MTSPTVTPSSPLALVARVPQGARASLAVALVSSALPLDLRGRSSHDLRLAASCYLRAEEQADPTTPPKGWPWADAEWRPPTDDVERWALAGALVGAAIEAEMLWRE